MSNLEYKSLLFSISERLEEFNALEDDRVRKRTLFVCREQIAHRADDTIPSLFSKLEEVGVLGVDSLQVLKVILKDEKQWDLYEQIVKFESIRREYKKLLERVISELGELNDLERLKSTVWGRVNIPEEGKNDIHDVRSLVQVLEKMFIGVDCLNLCREIFPELNDELLKELEEFKNRRTEDDERARQKGSLIT